LLISAIALRVKAKSPRPNQSSAQPAAS